MELWQVQRDYRLLAARLRRHRRHFDAQLDLIEAQLLEALLWCDRYETEACVLRLSRRCLVGRLKRTRKWVESAGLLKTLERSLVRKPAKEVLEELVELLPSHGCPPDPARHVLEELADVDRRAEQANVELVKATQLAVEHFQRLAAWIRVHGPHPAPSS
jgi:hypothetical protein